ncbi:MAG: iron transporter [Thermoleophilia bacterium]|nr:iron transporter [Thermoleophilia bacterium]
MQTRLKRLLKNETSAAGQHWAARCGVLSRVPKATMILLLGSLILFALGCGAGSGQATEPIDQAQAATSGEPDGGAAPAPGEVGFTEYPIGDPQEIEGLTVAAVYFQPVPMEPKTGLGPEETDIHIEADISASSGNTTGFGIGEFVPYLTVRYTLTKKDSGEVIEGSMMPMNASDGAHYGNNVKLAGAGTYELKFVIESPAEQNYALHTDEVTGVEGRFWRKPIELTWDFPYVERNWE